MSSVVVGKEAVDILLVVSYSSVRCQLSGLCQAVFLITDKSSGGNALSFVPGSGLSVAHEAAEAPEGGHIHHGEVERYERGPGLAAPVGQPQAQPTGGVEKDLQPQ